MNLSNKDELKSAIQNLHDELGENMPFLVEEQFTGEEYRIFITKNGDIAIVHRDPAHVIGDGIHTVQELAETESHHRMNPRTTCLCPIAIDSTVKHFLLTQGKTLTMIPKKTEKFYLRTNSNVAKGATCNDATEEAHPSVIEIAKKALKSLRGLPYAGIDLMTKDITKPQTETSYTIIEINPNPGFTMHMKPGKGTPRNVASFVADLIFPETKN
jgi:cyanophycin synthetase